jgi:hypothetical protein
VDRPLTTGKKWFLAVVSAWLGVSTVSSIAWIPRQSVLGQFVPVAIGVFLGCVLPFPVLAIQARLERSDRWMGRPRFVDWLTILLIILLTSNLVRWSSGLSYGHGAELLLGFLDGAFITFVIRRLRGAARPPGTSLPA